MKNFEVIIIGGGISGLHTAFELAKKGVSFKLLEARSRFGGRISSPLSGDSSVDSLGRSGFDIGPSWIWPGQKNIEHVIVELGLQDEIFEQFHRGDSLYEPASGEIVRGVAGISMQGALRMKGGLQTLIDTFCTQVQNLASHDSLSLNAKVSKFTLQDDGVQVSLESGESFFSKKAVLALPPRVALQEIEFSPRLPDARMKELNGIATWMAGHAKIVAIYDEPFWRNAGLSGDVISQKGPLSEIHDASPVDSGAFSLFGFLGTSPSDRLNDEGLIKAEILVQLTRLFGEKASSPRDIIYKNWANDPLTATSFDQVILGHHPVNAWNDKMEKTFNDRLIWSGTESDDGPYNGYIEGAIAASLSTLSEL